MFASMYDSIKDALNSAWNMLLSITPIDIVDMVLLTYLVYLFIKLMRETRAGQLIKGIILFIIAYLISKNIGLKAITYIIDRMLDIGLVALIVMFQPELRRALEKVGRTQLGVRLFGLGETVDEVTSKWSHAINAICDSCAELSSTCTGALIVIECQTKLGEQIDTGTVMHAAPSKELFGNIFYPKTPLHDGAVIMRDGEILAAACFLPKPSKEELINKKLGSRHRAAIGMSEVSDAIVVVVSEETGQISVAENGVLVRDYTKDKLKQHLMEQILPNPSDSWSRKPRKNPFRREKLTKGGDGK